MGPPVIRVDFKVYPQVEEMQTIRDTIREYDKYIVKLNIAESQMTDDRGIFLEYLPKENLWRIAFLFTSSEENSLTTYDDLINLAMECKRKCPSIMLTHAYVTIQLFD